MKTHSIKLSWIVAILFLFSCSNDDFDQASQIETSNNEDIFIQSCFDSDDDGTLSTRGVIIRNNKWPNGTLVKVKFLNGDATLQAKVKKYAKEWSMHGNVKFLYVSTDKDADIKVAFCFNGDNGNWSMSGIQSKKIAQDKPSMNFNFTSKSTDAFIKGNVLHEFGHALGLRHEQLHPENKIKWNKPVVYKYFEEKRGWTKEMVDKNFFNQINKDLTNYGIYDKSSIMHYRIDKSWTLDGFYINSIPNPTLSVQDKLFIAQEYPYPDNTKGLFSCLNQSQYYCISNNEDFHDDPIAFLGRIYYTLVPNTLPIYKYHNLSNGDRVLTLNWNELQNGSPTCKYEGIFGYTYKTKQANTIPVYRYYRKTPKPTHLYTLASNIDPADFKEEGIAFYILRN